MQAADPERKHFGRQILEVVRLRVHSSLVTDQLSVLVEEVVHCPAIPRSHRYSNLNTSTALDRLLRRQQRRYEDRSVVPGERHLELVEQTQNVRLDAERTARRLEQLLEVVRFHCAVLCVRVDLSDGHLEGFSYWLVIG